MTDDGLSARTNTPSPERQVWDPLGEIAANLARGFDCGNCDGTFGTHNCRADGCCSLHDGIYAELSHINRQLQAAKASVAAERERCAEICEEMGRAAATAIRQKK